MATVKSYTDLSQSKVLAKILPIESADMYYREVSFSFYKVEAEIPIGWYGLPPKGYYCWSLAALLNALPSLALDSSSDHHYRLHCMERFTEWHDNPIDACYEMIIKLNEQKLL